MRNREVQRLRKRLKEINSELKKHSDFILSGTKKLGIPESCFILESNGEFAGLNLESHHPFVENYKQWKKDNQGH